jgi:hypothetical protein
MNYATWQLNFSNPVYGSGPEEKISEDGGHAEGAWSSGPVENGSVIMGYISEPQNENSLLAWNFKNITQQEALDFCLAINPAAYLAEDGQIYAPEAEPSSK